MKLPFRKSYLRLLIIMILVTLITTGLCIAIIYRVVYNEKKVYLKELCVNQMNIIKSIYKETNDEKKILNIVKEQNKDYPILGKTGEYTIAILKNDSVKFLLDLRRTQYSNVGPIPWISASGIPIKFALSKRTGFIIGMDYSNRKVLAYCTYIPELNWGLVTKMDISEVNDPFYRAGLYAFLASLFLVLLGTLIFRKTFDPIIEVIIENENRYRSLFDYSAIPIWEVDFSALKAHFDRLIESGISDFRTYFEINRNEIKHLASLAKISYVNQKSVTFFEVNNKDEIIKNLLAYFNEDSLEVFKNQIVGFAEGMTHFETELPIRNLKGEIKTLLFHMSVMPGHENDLSEVLISFLDITKRKLAENMLLENEARLNRSQEIAHLGSWELDLENNILTWSDEVYRIFGLQPGEFVPTYDIFLEAIHPDDRNMVDELYRSSLKEGKDGYETEHRIIRKITGEVRYVYEKCFHFRDTGGKLIKSSGMVHDITDRKFIENTQLFLVSSGWLEKEVDFFQVLAKYLAETLQMDYVCISKLLEEDMNAQSVVIYLDGQLLDNKIYSLNNSPCNEVVGKATGIYPAGVLKLFPDDLKLQEIGAESYAGITLWSSGGKPIGLITLISRKPIKNPNIVESVINLVAIRTAGEMERKETEKALRESEQKLKYHFENSPLAVVEWDTDFIVTNWSKEAEHIFGWKFDEVVGKRIDTLNLIYEDDIPIVNRTIERLSGGMENTVVSTNRNYTKSEEVIVCIWYNSVLLDDKGQISSTMSLVEDITERKKAEEALSRSEENIRTILNATQESMYMFDKNGVIMAANITAAKRLELPQKDIIGHNFSEFIPANLAVTRKEYLNEVVNTGKPVRFEDIRNNIFFEHSFFPVLQNDEIIGVVSFSRDITERKKSEEALIKSEAQLKELNATKDKFFNIVAHDLKNPFTSLLGSTELLDDNIHLMDSEKIRKLAQILHDSAKSGYAILLNLLDWSRSQTGLIKLNPEPIHLKTLIDINISDLKLYANNKEIKLNSDVKDDIYVFADKNIVNTILRNLLSNAIKFTHKHGKINISTTIGIKEVTISVEDNGTGISEENIKKLFRIDTRFQLPGTEKEQGTGLGLKLCKEFVEKQGGRIWVKSIENKGSEFKFSIPVKRST